MKILALLFSFLVVCVVIFFIRRHRSSATRGSAEIRALEVGDPVTYPRSGKSGRGRATIQEIKKKDGIPVARMHNGSSALTRPLRELQLDR